MTKFLRMPVTPLHLTRDIEAVRRRTGEDADYVLSQSYEAVALIEDSGGTKEFAICVPGNLLTDLSSVPGWPGPDREGAAGIPILLSVSVRQCVSRSVRASLSSLPVACTPGGGTVVAIFSRTPCAPHGGRGCNTVSPAA